MKNGLAGPIYGTAFSTFTKHQSQQITTNPASFTTFTSKPWVSINLLNTSPKCCNLNEIRRNTSNNTKFLCEVFFIMRAVVFFNCLSTSYEKWNHLWRVHKVIKGAIRIIAFPLLWITLSWVKKARKSGDRDREQGFSVTAYLLTTTTIFRQKEFPELKRWFFGRHIPTEKLFWIQCFR